MNRTICVTILSTCAVLSYGQSTPSATSSTTPPPAKPVRPVKSRKVAATHPAKAMTIPADAVKTPEGAYRYKDPQGKSWLYRDTPFGVSRVPDMPAASSATGSVQTPFGASKGVPANRIMEVGPSKPNADPTEHVTAVAKGDTIQFQKPTPFGMTSWQKSKNDLTPDEQKIWDREQAKGTH